MTNVTKQEAGRDSSILVVDLDGTLLKGDLLWESLLSRLFPAPWCAGLIPVWFWKGGKALLKARLADHFSSDGRTLPWNPQTVDFCGSRFRSGTKIVIATASNEDLARKVTSHFNFVSGVMGSDASRNLKGSEKASLLVEKFGSSGFDYAGDSAADLPVWEAANKGFFVGHSSRLRELEGRLGKSLERIAGPDAGPAAIFLKAIRPHQWLKNLLVFIPLLAAHRWLDQRCWEQTIPVFMALCCMASASYLLNDLSDLDADRRHPRKKTRPLASGELGIFSALLFLCVFFCAGLLLAAASGPEAVLATLAYFMFSVFYSLFLKTIPVFDTVFLSGLYTYRIVLGGVASAVMVSPWLLAFSTTFFLGLALLKRYVELEALPENGAGKVPGRGYVKGDLELVRVSGISSGFLSVVVLALYLDSAASSVLYVTPQWLWGMGLALLFWIIRIWFLAGRKQMNDDPVWFAAKDPVTLGLGLVCLAFIAAAGPL